MARVLVAPRVGKCCSHLPHCKTVVSWKTHLKFSGNLVLRSKTGYIRFNFSNFVLRLLGTYYRDVQLLIYAKKIRFLRPATPGYPLKWYSAPKWTFSYRNLLNVPIILFYKCPTVPKLKILIQFNKNCNWDKHLKLDILKIAFFTRKNCFLLRDALTTLFNIFSPFFSRMKSILLR